MATDVFHLKVAFMPYLNHFFKREPLPHLCSFQIFFYRKIIDFIGLRTLIVRVEGMHADHLTITTALALSKCLKSETNRDFML